MSLRRRKKVIGRSAVLLVAGVVAVVGNACSLPASHPVSAAPSRHTVAVSRTTIAQRITLEGNLKRLEGAFARAQASGVITWLPPVGQKIDRGAVAFEIDGRGVRILIGDRPLWRGLRLGVAPGNDVIELKDNLRKLGCSQSLPDNGAFDGATSVCLKAWQKNWWGSGDGTLRPADVVAIGAGMQIGPPKISVGASVNPGDPVYGTESQELSVVIQVDPSQQYLIKQGAAVDVSLPGGHTTAATITALGTLVAAPGATPKREVFAAVTKSDEVAGLDNASVSVSLTTGQIENVLAVPVAALLSPSAGTYAVEVSDHGAWREVVVKPGMYDEGTGLVEVTSDQLRPGMLVEVPT